MWRKRIIAFGRPESSYVVIAVLSLPLHVLVSEIPYPAVCSEARFETAVSCEACLRLMSVFQICRVTWEKMDVVARAEKMASE